MNTNTVFIGVSITFSGENPANHDTILSKLSEFSIFEKTFQDDHTLCVSSICYGESEFQSLTELAMKISKDYDMNVVCEDIPL